MDAEPSGAKSEDKAKGMWHSGMVRVWAADGREGSRCTGAEHEDAEQAMDPEMARSLQANAEQKMDSEMGSRGAEQT